MKRRFLDEFLKKETLTEKLLKVVDDYEIYCSLLNCDIELGESLSSPIRASDDHPSFRLYIPTRLIEKGYDIRAEELWFKDLANGQYGDVFKFVKLFAAHQYGETLSTRYDVIKFIDQQLELGMFTDSGPMRVATQRQYERRVTFDLNYKSREFTRKDLEYWGRLGLEVADLEHFGIKSVRYLLDNKGFVRKEFRRNDLAYIYEIWDKCKLYQPEAPKSFKFRNTCPGDDYRYYQGFEQLTGEPNILIITKSYKDVMVFWKFFNKHLGIPVDVIAPHAESINLSKKFVSGVKENYDTILCVSDYDLAGVKFARQCRDYGFDYKFVSSVRILINGKFKVIDKDVSDFLINNGQDETIKLLRSWNINVK